MEKIRFEPLEQFTAWKAEYPKGWVFNHQRVIAEGLSGLVPTSFPCIFVFSIENDSDEGFFIVSDFVYPSDF